MARKRSALPRPFDHLVRAADAYSGIASHATPVSAGEGGEGQGAAEPSPPDPGKTAEQEKEEAAA